MKKSIDPEKISFEEACEFLQCTDAGLAKLIENGRIPAIKAEIEWVIPRRTFYAAVNRLAMTTAEENGGFYWARRVDPETHAAGDYVKRFPPI